MHANTAIAAPWTVMDVSKCISVHGEFSEHEYTGQNPTCDYCGQVSEMIAVDQLQTMRTALVAIQELHGRQLIHLPSWDPHGHPEYRESTRCKTCGSAENPCATRRLADDALGGDNNG